MILLIILSIFLAVEWHGFNKRKRIERRIRMLLCKNKKTSIVPNYLKLKANEYAIDDTAFSDILDDLKEMYKDAPDETEAIVGHVICKELKKIM